LVMVMIGVSMGLLLIIGEGRMTKAQFRLRSFVFGLD